MTARRLAAILAADVVGYSRLMGEDEAGTALSVRAHREAARPIVAGYGGRIVKTTGDGLLLEFPSVVAAVECAIAIQKLMVERNAETAEAKRIVYRIGVNLGDVLIEDDDILGDGVNIAARLEGLCEPGGVMISGAAYEHTRSRIDAEFVDLGEKELKNIAWPVRVYALDVGAPNGEPPQAKPAPALSPEKSAPPASLDRRSPFRQHRRRLEPRTLRRRGHGKPDHRSFAYSSLIRHRAQHRVHLQRQARRSEADRARIERPIRP
jgi:class 3 adenylate cyclase